MIVDLSGLPIAPEKDTIMMENGHFTRHLNSKFRIPNLKVTEYLKGGVFS